jgi:hypothetical protein
MKGHRWVGVTLAIGMAAGAFASCKSQGASSGTGGGKASSSKSSSAGTGGAAGGVGAGGEGGGGGMGADAGPIVCLSAYTNTKKGPCDLLQQNCPAGQTCVSVQSGAVVTTGCVPSEGLKTAGEPCYSSGECDAKLTCVGSPISKCVAFCCNDAQAEPCHGGLCNTQISLDTSGAYYAYVCSYGMHCTLLTPDACPAGQGCYVEDEAQGLALCDSRSPTPVPELGACTFLNDCATMQSCYFPTGFSSGVCLYYCDLTGSGTGATPGLGGCPSGEKCQASYQGKAISTGVPNIGLCIPEGGLVQPDGG